MTISTAEISPTIITGSGRFPQREKLKATWDEILATSRSWRDLDCAEYLREWCGDAPADVVDKLAGVNHVGIYLGDYERDEEVLAWNRYLTDLQAEGRITTVELGPSYISPRQYGTPGWWNSVVLPDGSAIEMFACRKFGPWLERPVDERRRLMSHVAIQVRAENHVRYVLDTLEKRVESLETIAFTEEDDLGHTYGHLRNNSSSTVVEVVFQAHRDERDGDR